MLSGAFDPATMWVPTARLYIIDLFYNTAVTTSAVASKGGYAACHFNAGSYEDWRPDSGLFAPSDRSATTGWLDIRSANVRSIMKQRIALCKQKGFVAVVPDGVDAYSNQNGLGLTAADQLSYNAFLADEAHKLGLAAGLKNDIEQVPQLLPSFDFFVNEGCMRYAECGLYKPARLANMAVWHVEYGSTKTPTTAFNDACKCQSTLGLKSIYKKSTLDAFRVECSATTKSCPYSARKLKYA